MNKLNELAKYNRYKLNDSIEDNLIPLVYLSTLV